MKKQLESYFMTQDKFSEEFEETKNELSKVTIKYEKLKVENDSKTTTI